MRASWVVFMGFVVAATACGGTAVEPGEGTGGTGTGGSGGSGGGSTGGTGGSATGGSGGSVGGSGGSSTGGFSGIGGSGGGIVDSGLPDTRPDAPPLKCPADIPTGTCNEENLECWYGDDPRPHCRTRMFCHQGMWEGSMFDCPPPIIGCPPDPSNVPDGICGAGEYLYCDYGGGVGCGCEWGGMGVPFWDCFRPPGGGCPTIVPNAGEPCSLPQGIQCQYGFMCGAVMMECVGAYWELVGEQVCAVAQG